jgi:broad specificity phosphatase PhoE
MVGKVYIVRHGQGVHNTVRDADENDPLLRDAKLTIRGQQQSVVLGQGVLNLSTVGLVMASPLRRSVHTALLAFSSVLNKRYFLSSEGGVSGGIDLILDPRLQETDAALYNTGSTGEELHAEWPNLDTAMLVAPWPEKSGVFDPSDEAVKQRAADLRQELWRRLNGLAAQPAKRDIVVVSHGGFVQELTGDMNLVIDNGKFKAFSMRMTAGVPELV